MRDASGEATRRAAKPRERGVRWAGLGEERACSYYCKFFIPTPGSYKISQEVRNLTATCADRWIAEVNIVNNNIERELIAISEVLTKFQAVSGVSFKLKKKSRSLQ